MTDRYDDTVAAGRRELSRLQHSVSDPPRPGGAEVRSGNAAELQTGLLHLLVVSDLLSLLRLQSENSLRDLKQRNKGSNTSNFVLDKLWNGPTYRGFMFLVLTWSLIPVAMWPTFTRRVSLIRMLLQLKSLMQTSTPEPFTKQRDTWCKGTMISHFTNKTRELLLFYHLTFKATGWW